MKGVRTTRTLRADVPTDVWDRFAAEAQAKSIPVGRHLRNLLVARDAKRYPAETNPDARPSIGTNKKEK